eukprot:scaffold104708_cov57-Phaeocystis_antarctica.AAC.1
MTLFSRVTSMSTPSHEEKPEVYDDRRSSGDHAVEARPSLIISSDVSWQRRTEAAGPGWRRQQRECWWRRRGSWHAGWQREGESHEQHWQPPRRACDGVERILVVKDSRAGHPVLETHRREQEFRGALVHRDDTAWALTQRVRHRAGWLKRGSRTEECAQKMKYRQD